MHKSKIKTIILCGSSPNHDISNLLFLKRNKDLLYKNNSYYFHFINQASSIFLNNPYEIYKKYNLKKEKIIIIKNNLRSRLRCLILIFLIQLNLSLKNELNNFLVIQPRPNWLRERFKKFGFILKNFNTILVGEGVGSECLTNKPAWLLRNEKKNNDNEKVNASYFVFSNQRINRNNLFNINSFQYERSELITVFRYYKKLFLKNNKKRFEEYYKSLFITNKEINILLTSTFYEYKRCTLSSEISLYINEIEKIEESGIKNVLIKPHPMTCFKKKQKLSDLQHFCLKKIKESNFKNNSRIDLISSIPIELLCTFFIEKNIKIIIYSCSGALIPSIFAYPEIRYQILFGKEKVKRYFIGEANIKERIKQEEEILSILDQNLN